MDTTVIIRSTAALLFVATATGCSYASKEDVEMLRNDLAQVRRVSEQALDTANEAQKTAMDAEKRYYRIEESMNRSFKKSMYK